MEPLELSRALLQPQVTVVATLGELLATLPRREEMLLLKSRRCLYQDLEEFTKDLEDTLCRIEDPWRRQDVTTDGDGPSTSDGDDDDDEPPTSLSRALANYKSTPGTTWHYVTMVASEWQGAVSVLVISWAQLARAATQLRNTCREVATKAATVVATATARARELQDEAARDGTALENMVELGLALGGEEGAEVVAGHEAQVRRDARVAASEATRATRRAQRVEEALGLLERLVAACDEATVFPRELQRRVGDIEAAMKGTNEASRDVPEDLVAKVAVAERLWEANARLAKGHLLGAVVKIIDLYFNGDPKSPSACEVSEWCQRAIKIIPRLLRPPERRLSVLKVSPVSMELQELSQSLLQPQVTVVATLGELLATMPGRDEMMVLVSSKRLYSDLKQFTKDLYDSMHRVEGTWRRRSVTPDDDADDDDDPPTSLSQALAAYESSPWATWDCVTLAASKWQGSVSALKDSWAKLARAATKLPNACREVVNEAATKAATATARARELQGEVARYRTAQEIMVELGLAPGREEGAEVVAGYEAWVRREARLAASEATRATMVRQWVEEALGLLERLVAACDEATAFPQELQRRVGDIRATLKGTNEASPNVPKDLVAKVAEAEQLWEANARLGDDYLLMAVLLIEDLYFDGDPKRPRACDVAKRCQRAIEDIPRLLQPLDSPQSIAIVSPVIVELQELFPSQLLEALVSVVATLGEVAATVTRPHRGVWRRVPPKSLHAALRRFTWSLRETLDHPGVTSLGDSGVTSLGQALAALRATPGATWANVRAAGSAWRALVAAVEQRWKELGEEATKLRDACEDAVPARAGDLREEATHRGTAGDNLAATAQQLMVALGRDEEASAGAMRDAEMVAATSEAVGEALVATRQARAAIRRGHWAEVALGPLQHLVDACGRARLFLSELQSRLGEVEATLEGTNDTTPDVPEVLVAKVAKAEQLWEASTRLFRQHLLGTLGDIHELLLSPYGGRGGPGSRAVAERCQKAIEDIPRLLPGQ